MCKDIKKDTNPVEQVNVEVKVYVANIVKYLCITSIAIVTIVFGYKTFLTIFNKNERE